MNQVDLHLHTTFSDGTLTPTEIVEVSANRGLRYISITDHDSTEGIVEGFKAARQYSDLELIPGVELSTDVPGTEIHLLGYFVDQNDIEFQNTLSVFRDSRKERAKRMVKKLSELNVKISWERVQEISNGASIGRPHIAQAMVESGYVNYPKDAFDKFLGRNAPAYVERIRLTPSDAIELLVKNGAIPIMAHPTFAIPNMNKDGLSKLTEMLVEMKEAGLAGLEVYYGLYSTEETNKLRTIAEDLELICTGGSDYHGSGNPEEAKIGTVGPPVTTMDLLKNSRKMT